MTIISTCKHDKKKKGEENFLLNPYTIAVCGYSNSGKTTLTTRLIKELSSQHDIGYLKHDARNFDIDKPGKDSFLARESGAVSVQINDSNSYAHINNSPSDNISQNNAFNSSDIIFVEGCKESSLPKIIIIDSENKILSEINKNRYSNIIVVIGQNDFPPQKLNYDGAYFQRNNISEIKKFIEKYFIKVSEEKKLYGLVLTGGKSTRMKKDKSLIEYHNKPQYQHGYELLSESCEKVFISCRAEQAALFQPDKYSQIHDKFLDCGPLSGILSALKSHPDRSWFILACDLPFISRNDIQHIIKERNPFKFATCYYNLENELPEPLCGIYESKIYYRILQYLGCGYDCPRKILINSNIKTIKPLSKQSLDNVNNPEEYNAAKKTLKG